jgi:hypothetical protein
MRRVFAFVGQVTLLLSASAALAQSAPPVEGAPANTPGASDGAGSAWWLIALVFVAVALVVWYVARNRNRT